MKTLKTLILMAFILSVFMPFPAADAAVKKSPAKHGKKIVHVKKSKVPSTSLRASKSKKLKVVKKKATADRMHKAKIISKAVQAEKAPRLPDISRNIPPVLKEPGSICVISHREVMVYFDEDVIGRSPVTVDGIRPGKHLVEAYIGSELYFRKYVEVKPQDELKIEINGVKEIAEEDPKFII